MIVWTPIAANEKPLLRGKSVLPEYSAAVIGSSVVLRIYSGGFGALQFSVTTIPFPDAKAAAAWIDANKTEFDYSLRLPAA